MEFTSDFLGLNRLIPDQNTSAITDRLVRLFYDTGLDNWTKRLVVVCTDWAAVNVSM